MGEHRAVIDDRHARAQLLELGKDVAADDDRLAQRPELTKQLAQLHARPRIQSGRRLVEQEHLRIVDQRVGQTQALLHAPRQRLDVRVSLVCQVDQVEQVADHPPPAGGGNPIAAAEEVQVLPDLHVVVDAERIRHESRDAAHLVGVPRDRVAADLGLARVRLEQGREDAQGGRLSRAVRPDETEDLARLDREVDPATRRPSGRSA